MFTCDTGGVVNRVVHLYTYADFDERDRCRRGSAGNAVWQEEYLPESRKCVQSQESSIYVPALPVMEAAGAVPLAEYQSPPREAGEAPVYEMRTCQLIAGLPTVRQMIDAFQKG